jgi:hypothetical protein
MIPSFYFSAVDYCFFLLINRLDNTTKEMIINPVTVIFMPVSPNFGRITKGSSHKYTVA